MSSTPRGKAWATWAIAIGLVGVFLAELPGGSTDIANLIELGALVIPTSLTPGEWWRYFSACCLHFGTLHLVLNVFGLLYLGQRLEHAWGRRFIILCYVATAVLSVALTPFFSDATQQPQALIGASGGIMGLLGGLLATLIVGLFANRNRTVMRQLIFLASLVALQAAFDFTSENVSSTCHLIGLTLGLAFGLVVARWSLKSKPVET